MRHTCTHPSSKFETRHPSTAFIVFAAKRTHFAPRVAEPPRNGRDPPNLFITFSTGQRRRHKMKSAKETLQERFSSEYEKYYLVDLFKKKGFIRKKCPNCGKHFWTLKPERQLCDDSTCSPYTFIGDPPTKKRLDYISAWNTVEKFFVRNGHTSVPRYPVVSRWRPDLFFTVASIVDFQRIEAGKVVFELP